MKTLSILIVLVFVVLVQYGQLQLTVEDMSESH